VILPFSQNQTLKSADEKYIGITKTKMKTCDALEDIKKKIRSLDLVI
jgi:hypothetical protein